MALFSLLRRRTSSRNPTGDAQAQQALGSSTRDGAKRSGMFGKLRKMCRGRKSAAAPQEASTAPSTETAACWECVLTAASARDSTAPAIEAYVQSATLPAAADSQPASPALAIPAGQSAALHRLKLADKLAKALAAQQRAEGCTDYSDIGAEDLQPQTCSHSSASLSDTSVTLRLEVAQQPPHENFSGFEPILVYSGGLDWIDIVQQTNPMQCDPLTDALLQAGSFRRHAAAEAAAKARRWS